MNYSYWKNYFENNRSHFRDIRWEDVDTLPTKEKELIGSSIRQFQKGENSEGKHLFSFAKKVPYPEYLDCIRLFIREEQAHARVLGIFMDKHNIPRIKSHWIDTVFRKLRIVAGLENSITVLLTAEIISKVYYDALRNAVSSVLLQKICRQILQDEDQHIAFQCFTLSSFYCKKSGLTKLAWQAFHLLLVAGTILAVWAYHKNVFKNGGYPFGRFVQETLRVYFSSRSAIKSQANWTQMFTPANAGK